MNKYANSEEEREKEGREGGRERKREREREREGGRAHACAPTWRKSCETLTLIE